MQSKTRGKKKIIKTQFAKHNPFSVSKSTCLFLSEGTFAFCSDILTVSHHHKILCLSFLLVAGACMGVQLGMLPNKLLFVCPSSLDGLHSVTPYYSIFNMLGLVQKKRFILSHHCCCKSRFLIRFWFLMEFFNIPKC